MHDTFRDGWLETESRTPTVPDLTVPDLEALKKQAALKALEHVESGMLIGLGTGSTAKYVIEGVGERLASGELTDITAIVTSKASETLAHDLDIPLVELTGQTLDVAIDGMDEVDGQLDAIKGLGGALTREKIVEACANFFILVGDETKQVTHLGEKAPVPVEVIPFGWQATKKKLENLGCRVERRSKEGETFVTDNGNFVLDCHLSPPVNAYALASDISSTPGVLEHGLFLGMAHLAYVATQSEVLTLKANRA